MRIIGIVLVISLLVLSGCGNSKINECVKTCAKEKINIPMQKDYWTQICDQTEWQRGDAGLDNLIAHCRNESTE